MCSSCGRWTPGQRPPPLDPNPEDCGKPAISHCIEGCKYAHGSPPEPFPPPCVPGSFCCPGVDPAFNMSKVVFAGNFADDMVLQRGPASAAVYGVATPGAHVEVKLTNSLSGYSWKSSLHIARADGDNEQRGTWKVLLPAQSAGSGYTVSASCKDCKDSSSTATATGVLFGDVWVVRNRQYSHYHIIISLLVLLDHCLCSAAGKVTWRPQWMSPSLATNLTLLQTLAGTLTSACFKSHGGR